MTRRVSTIILILLYYKYCVRRVLPPRFPERCYNAHTGEVQWENFWSFTSID